MKNFIKIVILLIAIGCSDDDVSPNDEANSKDNVKVKLLKKLTKVDDTIHSVLNTRYTLYYYDNSDRITVIESYDGNDHINSSSEYHYVGDTIKHYLYFEKELQKYWIKYPTNNASEIREDFYGTARNIPGVPYDSIMFLTYKLEKLNQCGKIERREQYRAKGEYRSYTVWDFNDENNSSTFERYRADGRLIQRGESIKINKIAYYNKNEDFDCYERSSISFKSWDEENNLRVDWSYDYEFDSDNYPVFMTRTDLIDHRTEKWSYEYY